MREINRVKVENLYSLTSDQISALHMLRNAPNGIKVICNGETAILNLSDAERQKLDQILKLKGD